MKLRNLALVAAVFVGLTNMAGAAFAQTKVFVVNEERVRRESKVGKELNAKLVTDANAAGDKLGLKIVAPMLSVVDDPTAADVGGKPVIGSYKIDDEGVAGARVQVIKDGVLTALLAAADRRLSTVGR